MKHFSATWKLQYERHYKSLLVYVFTVDDGDDAIKHDLGHDFFNREEGLDDRGRVGEAGGLDDDVVKGPLLLQELLHRRHQVASDVAAQTPVLHHDDFVNALFPVCNQGR